jgi:hypothetical protein
MKYEKSIVFMEIKYYFFLIIIILSYYVNRV